ncbi:hypothetical protein EWM64_g6926 [Hericium alpestre]|uniref:O-methyltransferase domain-containing protein n=1 Tax=Hericium alpestre TaxID=135208 RepID=A0A4Y9ZS37_9AGAM|nr:hypothetical protein EWM64_g6926 [Hericium alpestre]
MSFGSQSSDANTLALDGPEPLLPNSGAGGGMDLNIMIVANAKERSVEDVASLADGAGLQFVWCWDCVETGIVELKAK